MSCRVSALETGAIHVSLTDGHPFKGRAHTELEARLFAQVISKDENDLIQSEFSNSYRTSVKSYQKGSRSTQIDRCRSLFTQLMARCSGQIGAYRTTRTRQYKKDGFPQWALWLRVARPKRDDGKKDKLFTFAKTFLASDR